MKRSVRARDMLGVGLICIVVIVIALGLKSITIGNNHPNEMLAIYKAKKSTPLREVVETYSFATPVLAISGKDQAEKELTVFVSSRKGVEGYVYLQDGLPLQTVIEAARKHLKFEGEPDAVKLHWNGTKPSWYIQKGFGPNVTSGGVDFYTGKVWTSNIP